MNQYKNPQWWNKENDSAWDRVKLAMKRDWDQTKHDLGGKEPQTNQSIGHTTRQASGQEAIPPRGQAAYEEYGPAYRFGYGARSNYGEDYPEWDDTLESKLQTDWNATYPERKETWMQDRAAIRYAWDYEHDATENMRPVGSK
jgi:hypothetical protein